MRPGLGLTSLGEAAAEVPFSLSHISAGYGPVTVLRDVTVTLQAGSIVALLGPNGAGKTTLLRVASGLLQPSTGTVSVYGRDVTGVRSEDLARCGVCHIPEGRAIFRDLTVAENLALQSPPRQARQGSERAFEAFPLLRSRLSQLAGTLSGGEQQMLALARAYATRPSIVLLDEVSMGLAPKAVDAIFEFIERLAAEGVAILLVEQYVARALTIAVYAYVLDNGTIGFEGPPSEIDQDEVFKTYTHTDKSQPGAGPN